MDYDTSDSSGHMVTCRVFIIGENITMRKTYKLRKLIWINTLVLTFYMGAFMAVCWRW